MQINIVAFAVPLFLFFMGLEYYLTKRKGKNFFQYAESIANINVGIAERLLDVFMTGVFFFVFVYIHEHFALFAIKPNVITWIALFLLTDLIWYWYHRLAHEINIFWAAHVVHHQSEDFNYTVSARITVFQAIIRNGFWAILPFLGFPPLMITTFLLIHGLYPFFIHTQALGKWGIFEKFMVTPTHHGIHHASNPEYLDKNYGDVFIIWDKLFGTFVEEKNEVKIEYGLTKQLNSHSFLWQHFHFPLEIYMNWKAAKGFWAKWKVLFGKPDDLDPRFRTVLERKLVRNRHPFTPTLAMRQYVNAQTALSLVLLFLITLFEHYIPVMHLVILSLFIIISLINSGAILDQRRYIFYLEYARVALLITYIGIYNNNYWSLAGLGLATLFLIVFFKPLEKAYYRTLYR